MLAVLLARAGRPVAVDELAEFVWDGNPPDRAADTLRTYVMRLRNAIGPVAGARIVTRDPGYLIEAAAEEVDALRFARACRDGAAAYKAGQWAAARTALAGGLTLWRGDPLADVPSQLLRDAEVPALHRQRLQALHWRIAADLQLGGGEELVTELQALIAQEPLREQLHALLITALARSGRTSEALEVYRQARHLLVSQLGIEPGPELRELQRLILAGDPVRPRPVTRISPPPQPAPRQLPAAAGHFAGRAAELKELDAILDQAGPVTISAIGGMAGIGKTTLALHWAHQITDRFPDGQLYVNLLGFGPAAPLSPADALRGFLDALRDPARPLPADPDEHEALYRSLTADRRILVVLDNARDEQQVRPLLPGSPSCLTLITSRSQLPGLIATNGVISLNLDLLTETEAHELFTRRLGPERIAADPAAAQQLIATCAGLPLALCIAAARAALAPGLPLATLSAQLSQPGLHALSGTDSYTDLRSVFSWSYQRLSPDAARLFRCLPLFPGPDVSASAAASINPAARTSELLAELTRAHLLEEYVPGRFRLHDLLARYAQERSEQEDSEHIRREVMERVRTWDTAAAAAATQVADPDPGTALPPVPAVAAQVRYSLPTDTAAFTGRGAELDRISAVVAAGAGGVVAVGAIDGMPGVGKTALAVHIAHVLSGRFPDRQLFINLHAHTPGHLPVTAEDALAGLLAADGVDPRFVPGDLDGRAAMWRDRMAGQRALLVLDNAACSAQVAPLLPGDPGCLVLVTSRRHLGDLPGTVVPVLLDVLPAERAEEIFTRLAPRAAADPAGVAEVVRLAGFLPLAVSLLARVFARHRSWTLADLAAETRAGLLTLTAEQHSIAAAFDVSYRDLDPARRRFFDLLGLHPGATIDSYAAAALAGAGPGDAGRLLDGLHGEGLLTETGHRRYGMHDLLRSYARDHAAADPGGEQALSRLLDYFQHTATIAQDRLGRQARPGPPPAAPAALAAAPALEDSGQALAWARTERDSLLACLEHVTHVALHARVIALTGALAELLRRDGPWTEAITRHAIAVQSARHLGDRLGYANALSNLGNARRLTGDYIAAGDLEQALAIYRDLGDRLGQANALTSLGAVRRVTGDCMAAAEDLEQALAICREVGDRLGQANALSYLGDVRRVTGDYQGAAADLEQALAICREIGDRLGQANALSYLGDVRRLTGDYQGAAADLEQALAICREIGDRLGQANALNDLGKVRRLTGDYQGAAADLEQALAIYRDLGYRLGQANALNSLGAVRRVTGDYLGAAGDLEQALAIYRDLGSRLGQANALTYLGAVRQLTGDYLGAAGDLEQALAIYRDLGTRDGQAEVLNETGTLHRVTGRLVEAEACHQQALGLARTIGSAPHEAHALAGLGHCAATAGHATRAEPLLRHAHEIFQRIGAANAPSVLAELDVLTSQDPRSPGSTASSAASRNFPPPPQPKSCGSSPTA